MNLRKTLKLLLADNEKNHSLVGVALLDAMITEGDQDDGHLRDHADQIVQAPFRNLDQHK